MEVAERAAESEHRLSRLQLAGISPGNRGKVRGVYLDDGEIGELIYADDLAGKNAAIVQGDSDLRGAVNNVIVGDDVPVRRDDDAASNTVLQRLLLWRLHAATALTEELSEARGHALHLSALLLLLRHLFFRAARRDRDIDHRRRYACGKRFHRLIEGGEGSDAVIVERGSGHGGRMHAGMSGEHRHTQRDGSAQRHRKCRALHACN